MIWVYCKTADDPKEVGEYICKSNFDQENSGNESRVMKDEGEDDCWIIKSDCQNETSAIIYRIGKEVVVTEIDDSCSYSVIESLMKKYGFDNVKWLLAK